MRGSGWARRLGVVLPAVVAGLALVWVSAAQAAGGGAGAVPAAAAAGTCSVTWNLGTSFPVPVIYGDEADQISVVLIGCSTVGGQPTGNVTASASNASAGTFPLCTITLSPVPKSATSKGECTPAATALPSLSGGSVSWTLKAIYAGDANDAASKDSISNWTAVAQASTSVTLAVSQPASGGIYGSESDYGFTATVSPQYAGVPTGTVAVKDGTGTVVCTITLASSGKGSCSPGNPALDAGSYTASAYYAGSADFTASNSSGSPQGFTIGQAGTSVAVTESATTVTYGDESAAKFTATVTGNTLAGTPIGTVDIENWCTITLSGGTGSCTMPDTVQVPGAWPYDAVYNGDTNFAGDVASEPGLTINPAASTTALSLSQSSVADGSEGSETFTATVNPQYPGAGVPAGTVNVADSSALLCTITLSGGTGSCTLSASQLGTGSYQIVAGYGGEWYTSPPPVIPPYGTYLIDASTSAASTLTIASSSSSTVLSLSAARVAYGGEATEKFTATLTSPNPSIGTPVGAVTVATPAGPLCTITLSPGPTSATGTCSMTGTELPPGSYQLTATYAGNATFGGSVSAASTLTIVNEPTTTSLKLSAAKVTFGHENAERLTVKVKPRYPGKVTGKVTITAKAAKHLPVIVCVITLKSGKGTCTMPAKALQARTYTLTATYPGSPYLLTSAAPRKTLTIRK
jgi:hypothetical protein